MLTTDTLRYVWKMLLCKPMTLYCMCEIMLICKLMMLYGTCAYYRRESLVYKYHIRYTDGLYNRNTWIAALIMSRNEKRLI